MSGSFGSVFLVLCVYYSVTDVLTSLASVLLMPCTRKMLPTVTYPLVLFCMGKQVKVLQSLTTSYNVLQSLTTSYKGLQRLRFCYV